MNRINFLFIVIIFLLCNTITNAQNFIWARAIKGTNDIEDRAMVLDTADNIIFTATYNTNAIVGDTIYTTVGGRDIVLVKYSNNGNVLWSKNFGGVGEDYSKGLAVDKEGNIYMTGHFENSLYFFKEDTVSSTGGEDVFIAKFDKNGNLLWAKNVAWGRAGSTYNCRSERIAVDADNNLIICGSFNDYLFFDNDTLTSVGSENHYIAKYDNSGNFIWGKQIINNSTSSKLQGLGVFNTNIYVGGFYYGYIIIDGQTITSQGDADAMVMKLNSNGDLRWIKSAGGTNADRCNLITVEKSTDGCVFMCGYITGTANFSGTQITSNGNTDCFIARYDSAGTLRFVKNYGNAYAEIAYGISNDDITINYSGYFTSRSIWNLDTINTGSTTNNDVFLAIQDPEGNLVGAVKAAWGTGHERGQRIGIDKNRNTIIGGYFQSSKLYFTSDTLSNGGTNKKNIFIAKFSPYTMKIKLTPTHVSCNGTATGSITVSGIKGVSPYTYTWSNGATTQTISNLTAGKYYVTVSDAYSSAKDSIIITEPTLLTASVTGKDTICYLASTGFVNCSASGGSTPYVYSWSNGATTQNITNLTANTYTVTITDSKLCIKTCTYEIKQLDTMIISLAAQPTECGTTTGVAIVTDVIGGGNNYSYTWNTSPVQNNDTAINLSAGTYTVTVTSGYSCTNKASITVENTGGPIIITNVSNVLCYSGSTGSIDISVSEGTSPYTYTWSNNATTEDISGLAMGTYFVTVVDNNGCKGVANATITQPTLLSSTYSKTNNRCYGDSTGAINLSVSGGTSPYLFIWSNGITDEDIDSLIAGTYYVTISDNNGCIDYNTVVITQPTKVIASIPSYVNIICSGGSNGSLGAIASGGVTPYSYLWNNNKTTANITQLMAGVYTVTVSDTRACKSTATRTLTQPDSLAIIPTITNNNCYGQCLGSLSLSVSGGVSPYTYSWSGLNNTTSQASGLCAIPYTIAITDANSCSKIRSFTITSPPEILIDITVSDNNCYGNTDGSASAVVSGGVGNYTYSWSTNETTDNINNLSAGIYAITVKDGNGCSVMQAAIISEPDSLIASLNNTNNLCYQSCNGVINTSVSGGISPYTYTWSNNSTTASIIQLCSDVYTVTITDNKGCVKILSQQITEPNEISINATKQHISCYGACNGAITLVVSGGVLAYTYLWNIDKTTQHITELCADSYDVTVTDANSCSAVANIMITQPNEIMIDFTITDANIGANDGAIDIVVNGGSLPYTYSWSNGSTTQNISNLEPGTYYITITDAYNCSFIDSAEVNTLPTTIQIAKSKNAIAIYPNPSKGMVYIENASNMTMQVYDIVGKILVSQIIVKNKQSIDLSVLPNGIYFIELTTNETRLVYKLFLTE